GLLLHKAIESLQLRRVMKLLGKRVVRMQRQLIGHPDQPIDPPCISQIRRREMQMPKRRRAFHSPILPNIASKLLLAAGTTIRKKWVNLSPYGRGSDRQAMAFFMICPNEKRRLGRPRRLVRVMRRQLLSFFFL